MDGGGRTTTFDGAERGTTALGRRRLTALLLAATVVLGALPVAADAAPSFIDVGANTHADNIDGLAELGLTRGCDPEGTRYCPAASVTRGQMATFIARALRERGVALPSSPPDAFADDDGSPHEANIDALAAIGVVAGGTDGLYRPGREVNRGQMALFLQRGFELPETDLDLFVDVGGVYTEAANAIAVAGVTLGCDPEGTRYCPTDPVRRDQMASFLMRALSLPIRPGDGPSGGPPPAPDEVPPLTEAATTTAADAGTESGDVFRAAGSGTYSAGCGMVGTTFGTTVKIDDSNLAPAWGWSSQWVATRHWRYTVPPDGALEQGQWVITQNWSVFLVADSPLPAFSIVGGNSAIPLGWTASYLEVMAHDNQRWHTTISDWVAYTPGGWWCLNF